MTEETMVMPYQESTTQRRKVPGAATPEPDMLTMAHHKRQRPILDELITIKVIVPVKKCCRYISETSKAIQARPGQLWFSALPLIVLLLATLFLLLDW
jgi:hypothetical protein